MYLSPEAIAASLITLERIHPFFGVTFLVFKQGFLPIGETVEFPINNAEKEFMDRYYKPYPDSEYYYRVFITSDKRKRWLDKKYPSAGSQSMRTRGSKADALIHDRNTRLWGWQPNYVEILHRELGNDLIPMLDLAVWLYRDIDWPQATNLNDLLQKLVADFNLTTAERKELFNASLPTGDFSSYFRDYPLSVDDLHDVFGVPPDAPAEAGGTLAQLDLLGIGPAPLMSFSPGRRMNLVTGDNGLGKSFLLECSWWALTGQWVDPSLPAYPSPEHETVAQIRFRIAGEGSQGEMVSVTFDQQQLTWPPRPVDQTIPGLVVYARADNSFAVWDPAQHYRAAAQQRLPSAYIFSWDQIWNGLEIGEGARKRYVCNGLIRDWVSWQSRPSDKIFDTFTRVLAHLSPDESDIGVLSPGQPTRIPDDARDIPTLHLPYGEVPVLYASEGMRRIMALAYLLVWSWDEHKAQSQLADKAPQRRLVVIVDEIESHLHPKWQRLVLPALLEVQADLDVELEMQLLVATHSPLVMASVEPVFTTEADKLFHLDLIPDGLWSKKVILKELSFVKHGRADAWLTSNVFELSQSRSVEAERAIDAAKRIQLKQQPTLAEVEEISRLLLRFLAPDDTFWPRWMYFAEQHGVSL